MDRNSHFGVDDNGKPTAIPNANEMQEREKEKKSSNLKLAHENAPLWHGSERVEDEN